MQKLEIAFTNEDQKINKSSLKLKRYVLCLTTIIKLKVIILDQFYLIIKIKGQKLFWNTWSKNRAWKWTRKR